MNNTSPDNNKYITVDGVTYNVTTGRAESAQVARRRPSSDSIRKAAPSAASSHTSMSDITSPGQPKQALPKTMGFIDLPQKKKFRRRKKPAKQTAKTAPVYTGHSFGWFFGKALLPGGFSAAAWAFSVLRGVTSPQAWFLAALPIVILELQNVVFENINGLLSRAHLATQNGQVFHILPSIVVIISLAISILFMRVLFNAIAMHLRITFLAKHPARLWPAVRMVLHNSLKILVHGAIQLLCITIVSFVAFGVGYWLIAFPHNATIQAFVPYIVGGLGLVWVVLICLLHAKHWVQTAILSSSLKTTKVQRRSLQVIMAFPVRSAILAIISFGLTVGVWAYGIWAAFKTIDWLNRAIVPANSRFVLLISSIFVLVVLVGYLQQTIWAAYSSWANQQYKPKLFILASDTDCKQASIWQIWVSIYAVLMAIAVVSLGLVFVLPVVNSAAVNISAHLPSKIDIPHISK
jgi:hypothetical protein